MEFKTYTDEQLNNWGYLLSDDLTHNAEAVLKDNKDAIDFFYRTVKKRIQNDAEINYGDAPAIVKTTRSDIEPDCKIAWLMAVLGDVIARLGRQ